MTSAKKYQAAFVPSLSVFDFNEKAFPGGESPEI